MSTRIYGDHNPKGPRHGMHCAMLGDATPRAGNTMLRCECGARLYESNIKRHRLMECALRFPPAPPKKQPKAKRAKCKCGAEVAARYLKQHKADFCPLRKPVEVAIVQMSAAPEIIVKLPEKWPPADFCKGPITRYAGQEIGRG